MLAALKLFETLDYTIIGIFMLFLFATAVWTKRLNRSTADFLAANRLAGRYMLVMATAMAYIGASTIVSNWQVKFSSGVGASWWGLITVPIGLIIAVTGWVAYRYRETRAMTLGQFFEMRYGRKYRLFASIVSFLSGMINNGIIPAIGANFFINFCGIPKAIPFTDIIPSMSPDFWLADYVLLTFPLMAIALVAVSLYFTLQGGQITVLVTDFLQQFFTYIVVAITLIILLVKFNIWDVYGNLMTSAPGGGVSMLNPFDAGNVDFDPIFYFIMIWTTIYTRQAWQGHSAYYVSAKSPHESKMAGILATLRFWAMDQGIMLIPLVAFMIMTVPQYASQATEVNAALAGIENAQLRNQMIVPMTMKLYLPVGMMGAFAAVMLAAFISTNDTMLHSWGTIFIQDVVMPLRKKPFAPKTHMLLLKLSICGSAVFFILFSCFYDQGEYIRLYMAITSSLWMAGAGICIIGGLYTRWGTTAGAYSALVVGAINAFVGIFGQHIWKANDPREFPLRWDRMAFWGAIFSVLTYTVVSTAGKRCRKVSTSITCAIVAAGTIAASLLLLCNNWSTWTDVHIINKHSINLRILVGLGAGAIAYISVAWILRPNAKKVEAHLSGAIAALLFAVPPIILGAGLFTFSYWSFQIGPVQKSVMILIAGALSFLGVSYLTGRHNFNLEKMLHRDEYADERDRPKQAKTGPDGKSMFRKIFLPGLTKEFTKGDKIIYGIVVAKTLFTLSYFVVWTILAITMDFGEAEWRWFHYCLFMFFALTSFILVVWLSAGGMRDLYLMVRDLKAVRRDDGDDGWVDQDFAKQAEEEDEDQN